VTFLALLIFMLPVLFLFAAEELSQTLFGSFVAGAPGFRGHSLMDFLRKFSPM